ncbi:SEL1-like repeat protein [Akkermansiaceae bacterium]|nr:SEL1-like repeat protein [Akkermansiaceae bacterium]
MDRIKMVRNYFHGDGVVENATEAVKWYRKALLRNRIQSFNDESLEVVTLTLLSKLY